MSKVNPEPAVAFVEVSRSVKSSGPQHSSPTFDGRFMVYCQGLKLFIPAKSALGDEAVMMRRLAEDVSHIYLATGATDYRKHSPNSPSDILF